jgi:hypothetical protein
MSNKLKRQERKFEFRKAMSEDPEASDERYLIRGTLRCADTRQRQRGKRLILGNG